MYKLEARINQSTWNFENKWLLLKAEFQFCNGEFAEARDTYVNAIESAQRHKFLNEEAVAYECSGYFEVERGNKEEAIRLFRKSIECYTLWGSAEK